MTSHSSPVTHHRVLALIGANGMLADAVKRLCPEQYRIVPFDLPEFDITNREQVVKMMEEVRPQVIVNCAAYTDVDGCETNIPLAEQVNGEGPGHLALAAKNIGATLVHISTDYVFNGQNSTPYTEEDPTDPQSAYGRSKLAGEQTVLESGLEEYFIIRTSWLYGRGGKNFVETILRLAREREELRIVADQVGSPTYTEDLATVIFKLLEIARRPSPVTGHSPYGIYHFSNEGQCSWYQFTGEIVAQTLERGEVLKVETIHPITTEEYPLPAHRPAYSVLSKAKIKGLTGFEIPDWRISLNHYLQERNR